jgi:hypothetical protein
MTIDCSIQAQDDRRRMLKELLEKRYSGVSSISDRSRSVNYQSPGDLARLIKSLQQEIDYCETGQIARPRRFVHLPYNKWL